MPLSFWDTNYAVDGYKYGTEPNRFLVEQSRRFPANARILLPGDGEGRNGVWLAKQGHRIVSIDSSEVGLRKSRQLAKDAGVSIQTILADLSAWTPPTELADVVVATYLHLPPEIRGAIHRKLAESLKPGGLFVVEAFHPNQLNYSSGGPKAPDMLYSLATVRSDLSSIMRELYAAEAEITLDEGPGHQGPAYVTRWVGASATDPTT